MVLIMVMVMVMMLLMIVLLLIAYGRSIAWVIGPLLRLVLLAVYVLEANQVFMVGSTAT